MRKNNREAKIIFALYCLVLVWVIMFKMAFSLSDVPFFTGAREVNFIPFYYDRDVGSFHIREVILNVLVFVPFGVYLSMLDVDWKKAILSGFALSFIFEAGQFALAIGAGDVTDIITNTLGTVIGVIFYAVFRRIFSRKKTADLIINVLVANALKLFFVLAAILFVFNS